MCKRIGAVLAGGRGRRIGGDKALLDVGGRTLVRRAVDVVREVGLSPVVLLRADQEVPEETASVPVVRDELPNAGPLAGLHALLRWSREEWALVVACDQPFLAADLLRGLMAQASVDVDAVVGRSDEFREPLPGLYRRTCLPAVENMLARRERDFQRLLSSVRVYEVPGDLLREWDAKLLSYTNVNTPAELSRARDMAGGRGGEDGDS